MIKDDLKLGTIYKDMDLFKIVKPLSESADPFSALKKAKEAKNIKAPSKSQFKALDLKEFDISPAGHDTGINSQYVVDVILDDSELTADDINHIQHVLKQYMNIVSLMNGGESWKDVHYVVSDIDIMDNAGVLNVQAPIDSGMLVDQIAGELVNKLQPKTEWFKPDNKAEIIAASKPTKAYAATFDKIKHDPVPNTFGGLFEDAVEFSFHFNKEYDEYNSQPIVNIIKMAINQCVFHHGSFKDITTKEITNIHVNGSTVLVTIPAHTQSPIYTGPKVFQDNILNYINMLLDMYNKGELNEKEY
jgi:hypothetical protein